MADRIVAMHEGVARQIGTPTEIYDSLEYMGATTLVHVSSGAHRLRLMTPGLPDARPGERVGLVVDLDALYLFDAASGERIGP